MCILPNIPVWDLEELTKRRPLRVFAWERPMRFESS
jgi:hypothetical protein